MAMPDLDSALEDDHRDDGSPGDVEISPLEVVMTAIAEAENGTQDQIRKGNICAPAD